MKLQFHIDRRPEFRTVQIFLSGEDDGRQIIAEPISMRLATNEDRGLRQLPILTIQDEDADFALQSLMDQLWEAGIRPADIGTPGHLAATKANLADFRAIAAKLLAVDLPKI